MAGCLESAPATHVTRPSRRWLLNRSRPPEARVSLVTTEVARRGGLETAGGAGVCASLRPRHDVAPRGARPGFRLSWRQTRPGWRNWQTHGT